MGKMLLKMKMMPASPETNLEEIKGKATEAIAKNHGEKVSFEEEPIAFGLKALIAGFELDEKHEIDPIEEALSTIENVNSVQVADMRRAFG